MTGDARGIGLKMSENLPREALYDRDAIREEYETLLSRRNYILTIPRIPRTPLHFPPPLTPPHTPPYTPRKLSVPCYPEEVPCPLMSLENT